MTVKHLFPTVEPALNLDFQNARELDPRITFTRASDATYVDPVTKLIKTAVTDEARFEKEGLLIEESRTNLYPNSEDYGAWTKDLTYWSLTSNAVVAPNGTLTATKCIPKVGINTQSIYAITALNAGTTYTASAFFKAAELTKVALRGATQSDSIAVLADLSTGFITETGCTGTIQPLADGWFRVTMTWTQSSTDTAAKSGFGINPVSGETFDGVNGFYVWGSQIEEAGAFPTSYIPTSGVAATRAADLASITGTNFSSWYNQSEGTIYADFDKATTERQNPFALSDGTQTNRMSAYYVDNTVVTYMSSPAGGFNQSIYTTSSPLLSKYVLGYSSGNTRPAINGNLGTTITEPNLPTNTTLFLGRTEKGDVLEMLTGHISRLTYYPVRLPDEQLQALTA